METQKTSGAAQVGITDDFLEPKKLLRHIGVGPGDTTADLGCGTGYLTIPLARAVGKDGKVRAVDIMKVKLASIQDIALDSGLRNIETIWADLEVLGSTKIKDSSMDFTFLVNIFFQLENDEEVLKEANRITKKGGKVVVIDWKKEDSPIGPPLDKRRDGKDIISMADAIGLSLDHDFEVDKYHYGYIFKK